MPSGSQQTKLNRVLQYPSFILSVNATTSAGSDSLSLTIGFALDFGATLAGVFIALYLTFRHERRTRILEEREIQKRIVSALRTEIEKDFDDVKANISQLGPSSVIVAIFRVSAYQSAVNSGNLSLLKEDIRNSLANIYLNIQFVETLAAKKFTMLGTIADDQWRQSGTRVDQMLTDRLNILNRDIPGTLELLNQEYNLLSQE